VLGLFLYAVEAYVTTSKTAENRFVPVSVRPVFSLLLYLCAIFVLLSPQRPRVARAQAAPGAASDSQPAAAPPAPPPYSLPWQLRPAAIGTVVRSDTAFAFYKPATEGGSTVASMLAGTYKLTPEFAPLVRLGVVSNSPRSGPMSPGSGF